MTVPEEILRQACTTGCRRYADASCPFRCEEKDLCPLVKPLLQKDAGTKEC